MRIALLLAATFLLAHEAPPATATTLFATSVPDEHSLTQLHVRSESHARNAVTVTADRPPTFERQPTYVIRDPGERLRLKPSAKCRRLSRHAARCPNVDILSLELGPGNDTGRMGLKHYGKPTFYALATLGMEGGRGDDDLRSRYASADGGPGADLLRGVQRVRGGPGDDRVRGGRTRDILEGGEGNDVLYGGPHRDELYGGYYVDEVSAPAGRDRLVGGSGDDLFEDNDRGPSSRVDADRLIGGRGDDAVSYHPADKRVFVNLTRPGGAGEPGENDVLTGMEEVTGGDADDYLIGDSDSNFFRTGPGDDVVRARGGDDEIWAEDGADDVRGQLGADEIVLFPQAAGAELGCGAGADVVTQPVIQPDPRGVLVPVDCERVRVRTYSSQGVPEKVAIGPVPELPAADELTFAIFNFSCCEYRLSVTESVDPFAELGSASIDSERVSVPLPAETADRARQERVELRAALYGSGPEPVLIWRFVPEAP